MEKRPFISVVMPVYNAEKYIESIIQNVLKQTFTDWELIIVNDCSKDGSGAICDMYSKKDERIRVLHLEKNGGAGNARNKGIDMAKGEYLTFLDADDEIEFELYQKVYEIINQFHVEVVTWGLVEEYFDKENMLKSTNEITFPKKLCSTKKEVEKTVPLLEERTLLGYQWNKAYKKEIIDKNNIRFEDAILYEDYFFNIAIIKHVESMYVLEDVLYHYKKRFNESITTRFVPEYFELSHRRVETLYMLCKEWKIESNRTKQILGQIYMRYILSALMRNSDKRSGMNWNEQKEWIKRSTKANLYEDLVNSTEICNKQLRFVQRLIDGKHYNSCVAVGNVICLVKQSVPLFFSLIKRNK